MNRRETNENQANSGCAAGVCHAAADRGAGENHRRGCGGDNRKGNLWSVAEGCSIGGDRFGNYEGILPDQKGRKWTECDIDFDGGYRNGKRVVFSNDGLIYYTGDHYQTFDEVEVIWTDKDDSFLSGEELKDFVNWLYGE